MAQKKLLSTNQKTKTSSHSNPVKINKPVFKPKVFEIDASGKILGRLSTEVATILRGKNKPEFKPNLIIGDKVIINNAAKIKVTGSKMTQKIYYHHTGYLGHLKSCTLKELFKKNPSEVIKRSIWGMLPKNKLRKIWMQNLIIKNGE